MESSESSRLTPAIGAAAQRLRIDYATAEVLRAFHAAGVESVLLKGASVARWLYEPDERRMYVDCDLLVRPGDLATASDVLTELGFEPELDEAGMPGWWREHGLGWFRLEDRSAVDLHRTLPGAGVDPERLWGTLSGTTEEVVVAGYPARALAAPGRALHVALHAAQHGGMPRQLVELERALERTDAETWRDAAILAAELRATAAFATGLRFVAGGRAVADRLELPSEQSIEVALRAGGAVEALTVERISQARGARRLLMVLDKLAPPPTFMRKWSPLARRGRAGLAAAYLWRPIWIVSRAPRALRDWRAARRVAGRRG